MEYLKKNSYLRSFMKELYKGDSDGEDDSIVDKVEDVV